MDSFTGNALNMQIFTYSEGNFIKNYEYIFMGISVKYNIFSGTTMPHHSTTHITCLKTNSGPPQFLGKKICLTLQFPDVKQN